MSAKPTAAQLSVAALVASFPLFLSQLLDLAGQHLELPAHLLVWAELLVAEPRLILRAPRSHGKTTLVLAYVAWCCWRHGRSSASEASAPGGTFEAVLFSATHEQALLLMARFRDLLIANEALFGSLVPDAAGRARGDGKWSSTEIRLRNHAGLRIRAYGTSTRGMHPDLLLLDDVLSDANSLAAEQRDRTARYFLGTLLPMHPRRIVLIGTAIHQDDLLARLARGAGPGVDRRRTTLGFYAETYRAYDDETGESLWPERFPAADLLAVRDADPLVFSREYQNDPRDDSAALFAYEVTARAVDAGADLILGLPVGPGEIPVLGLDLAVSASARADFTVAIVVAYNLATGHRRVLDIRRGKGLDFEGQVALVRELMSRYRVELGIVEQNAFQGWLLDVLRTYPEGNRLLGHRTGSNKADLQFGIPGLALAFKVGQWVIPSGDPTSMRVARQFQAELAAFGYLKNGRLAGAGEHDDMVMAAWFVELAIRFIEELRRQPPREEIVTMEELGIPRYEIGDWDRPEAW